MRVYYHQLRPRVPLDPAPHIVDSDDHVCKGPTKTTAAWAIPFSCRLDDTATHFGPVGNAHTWPVYRTELSSHPVTAHLQVLDGVQVVHQV
jgi:hypothetical protein